jgi:hypothetical protein
MSHAGVYIFPAGKYNPLIDSHEQVVIFALVMGIAGVIFYYIGVSMGWLYVSFFFVPRTMC